MHHRFTIAYSPFLVQKTIAARDYSHLLDFPNSWQTLLGDQWDDCCPWLVESIKHKNPAVRKIILWHVYARRELGDDVIQAVTDSFKQYRDIDAFWALCISRENYQDELLAFLVSCSRLEYDALLESLRFLEEKSMFRWS